MRYKYLQFSFVLLLGFGLTGLQAQENFNTTGRNALGAGGSVSYSIGQIFYTTNSGTNGSVAQGVQQVYDISLVSTIENAKGINLTVTIYPNPTIDYLILSINEFDISNLSYQLYDINGKIIQSEKIMGNQTSIVMSNYLPATYFLRVIQGDKEVKMFKIIKK